ncbi:MAG: lipopolysaccharide heptosyltransferase I [Gammaproteobacteria bacterium]|nr:MAG: lipopolysaccharide heptosyltransferase I [Gammaproteobacteria bacterium]
MRVLLIKMSSLGDVIHALPAVSDAHARGIRFDWVVEEAFATVPARHPGVENVLPIAWRRWRTDLFANRFELSTFVKKLRSERYDLVLDAQGLLKSGAILALSRGTLKAGFSRRTAREGATAVFYQRRISVALGQHAIDRQRQLFAGALGYELPHTEKLDYGIVRGVSPSRTCVLLHGTTWSSKHWPESMWMELARLASGAGYRVALPWGDEVERARAERIAKATEAEVWDRVPLAELANRLEKAELAIGVDSGLAHLCAALNVPTLVMYGSTDSALTGCRGAKVAIAQVNFPCAPCLQRTCGYRGKPQYWREQVISPACYSKLAPEGIWQLAQETFDADRVLPV